MIKKSLSTPELRRFGPIIIALDEEGDFVPEYSGDKLVLRGWWIFSYFDKVPFKKEEFANPLKGNEEESIPAKNTEKQRVLEN
mgnify:CR=1 FL=1